MLSFPLCQILLGGDTVFGKWEFDQIVCGKWESIDENLWEVGFSEIGVGSGNLKITSEGSGKMPVMSDLTI